MKYESLFSPIVLAGQEIKNRIAMAPMGCSRESQYGDGRVSTELIDCFEERAKGGVGMIISPFIAVDKRYYSMTLALFNSEHLLGISRLAEAIKVFDCKFILQLAHFGGKYTKGFEYERDPIAPSCIKSRMYPFSPKEMNNAEIEETINLFIQCGEMAKNVGCNGVELHAAHGYLINQFISPHANRRNDEYGGTLEKRMNFVSKVVKGIREKCGDDFIIGIKYSAHEHLDGGIDINEAKRIAVFIEEQGIINYLHVSVFTPPLMGFLDCDYPTVPPTYTPHPLVPLAAEIKKSVKIPVIAAGGLNNPEYINQIIAEGKTDMVALGRALIADPEWPKKAKTNGNIKYCILCNTCHLRGMNQKTIKCSVNPYMNEERRYSVYLKEKANTSKKVMVIGAGPAGMEAAITACKRGHNVILAEKSNRIGGLLKVASIPNFKKGVLDLLNYYKTEIDHSDIELRLGVDVNAEYIFKEDINAVIISVGADLVIPKIKGIDNDFVFDSALALGNEDLIAGNNILVIGGGLVGLETALHFAMKGKRVKIIDFICFEDILRDEHIENKSMLIRNLWKNNVEIFTEKLIREIKKNHEVIIEDKNNKIELLKTDNIIFSTGYIPKKGFVQEIKENILRSHPDLEIYSIGDCVSCDKIFNAINSGANSAWCL
jgi:2,4-dienoyl-CoA reductase-like NADH-dependent reductase (Old Yellow Enzyme family)/thioredoxin reductase